MTDKEFAELQLRATIVPRQARWPAPELLHWQRLHEAANEARERARKAYAQMDEIDRNADVPPDAKYRERSAIAANAISDFEELKTLRSAREAVALVVAQHEKDEDAMKAMKEADQGWRRAIDKIAERACLTKGPDRRR